MDIGSRRGYPAGALSNFCPRKFVVEGIQCNSMEGFLQSLKFKNPEMQIHVCTLVGKTAKFKGKKKKWFRTQTLWWKGVEIDRHSEKYQQLIDKAYDALAENGGFKKTLLATQKAVLTHSLGQNNTHRTILTEREFCSRLTKLRQKLETNV